MKKKLAIVTTHPIQYYAPVFKLMHERANIEIRVFYTWGESVLKKHDPGFNKQINWDIPLLEGYPYEWVKNTAKDPGSDRFTGIVNPLLTDQVLTWQPDAVLIYGWAYAGHINLMRKLYRKIPLHFRGDSTLLNEPKGLKKISKYILLNWIYRHLSCAFYVGLNNKNYFKYYGLTDAQLIFAPHAIDNERFNVCHDMEAAQLRSSVNVKKEDILILYAGKFEAVKNVSLLLKAFIALNKKNVHLLLAGTGLEENALRKLTEKSTLTGNIHFMGFINQLFMPVLYQSADLVCLPSKSETWGLTINEAMACSKAVLVSDKVGCAADLVKENFNGRVFKSDDEDDLLKHLKGLTRSKALLAVYGENSANMIKAWNFNAIAKAVEDKLLNKKVVSI